MSLARIDKWGRGLAVRLPGEVVRAAKLHDGERVEIEARDSEIVIRRATPRITIEGIFHGASPKIWRQEYAGACDWGPDTGREIVEP